MVDIMVSDFMKGRYNLMKIFVGIDIAKLNHFAAAISSDGEIIHWAVQIHKWRWWLPTASL